MAGVSFNEEERMISTRKSMAAMAVLTAGALASAIALGAEVDVKLSGANEVPPVAAAGSGVGKFKIEDSGAVSGAVMTTGVAGTAAHIHQAAAGKNGPVIIPLTKDGDTYTVPAGAKLSADQLRAFKAGELYVNVHTAANKGGEVRAQLK
jgi:hypothetical protein